MNRYTLSIGSNATDSPVRLAKAAEWLRREFDDVVTSEIYSSAPLSGIGPDYSNMVAMVSSDLTPEAMTAKGKEYERQCGRTAESKKSGMVQMDVDVVLCDDIVLRPSEMIRSYFRRGYDSLIALVK